VSERVFERASEHYGAVLYPAIDVRSGRVVRLRRGDYALETVYSDDPADVAAQFGEQGASWLHVVDLDAARTGEPVNRAVVEAIVDVVSPFVAAVQVGGGVRSLDAAKALADIGVSRVVMGSAAVGSPGLVEEVATVVPVAVGLDHRSGVLAVDGWTKQSDVSLVDVLAGQSAASAYVITDISRDGTLVGPDVTGLAAAVAATAVPVIASGGVGTLDDVRALAAIDGLHGIIVGRALYEGRFTLAEALAVTG
jgi:phosphoribosylformimino-5-aminoimidazole carboxamide ribotide isomerase